MSDLTIKQKVSEAMKLAMREKDKARLAAIRLVLAEFKQVEVDERIDLTDERSLAILDKMLKQRRDSIDQFKSAGRDELAEKEQFEVGVIQYFMPQQMSEEEVDEVINAAFAETGASSMKDMGKVMALLKPKLQGRTDFSKVSIKVKAKFN